MSILPYSKPIEHTPGSRKEYLGKPVIETLTNGYFIVDDKWTVKYWNKAAEKILGVPGIKILGKNIWEEFAGSIPVEFYAVYYKAFLKDVPMHFTEYWAEKDTWFDVTAWHYSNALYVSFKSSNHTYPEYPANQEKRLRTLTELYKFVTEITNDCLWEWDLLNKEIFWIDGGHKRVFGYPIENTLVPESFWKNCLHPDDSVRVMAGLRKAISSGKDCTWEEEYRFKTANGNYVYVHDRGHILFDEQQKATRIIGATQDINDKILGKLALQKELAVREKEITNAVLTALENERASIGRELHDNLCQILVVAKMHLEIVQKTELNKDVNIDRSFVLITEVIEQIRNISRDLIIPPPHLISVFENIKILLADLMMIHPIVIEFQLSGVKEDKLNEDLQVNIFRIVQEQMGNILKHSKATRASIVISQQKNDITLTISDNGIGCDLLQEKKGVGVINIKSRVNFLQGRMTITSRPSMGYKLKAVFPILQNV